MNTVLALADRNVPRYTSYPTAPNFTAAVGAETYAEWLSALPEAATLSLYIHVPYCTHLCFFCGCHTKAVRRSGPIEHYTERLIDEIALVGATVGCRKVVHLHWGGGTPSILGERRLAAITGKIGASFDLSALREHAIELDPRRLSKQLVRALAGIGVTRASVGVQDCSLHVQKASGRIQPFVLVEEAVDWLRAAGIDNINVDLMYGLPRQTADNVAHSARRTASLSPQQLALFGYAHVPWLRPRQRLIDDASLPGPLQRLEQVRTAAAVLQSAGYVPIGLDHFALPGDSLAEAARTGRLRRNFQGYTTDEADALIGLGASAISKLPQGFVQNAPDIAGYSRAIEASRLASMKGVALSADDRLRAHIIERLMCDLAVDLDEAAADRDFSAEIAALKALAEEGLVKLDGRTVAATERGRPFLRLIAAAFDVYLPARQTRHSIAV